jgi:hypothetical protein
MGLSFKTVNASVRPARVAVLVDKADQDWQHTCLRIIEFYSQLWGGAHNIIVPTNGSEITDPFWTLLEAFDPNYLYRYAKSVEDLAQSHPERYADLLKRRVDASIAAGHSGDRAAITADLDRHLRGSWLESTFGIAPELHKEIKTRLAPFWFQQYVVEAGPIYAGCAPSPHLTDITKIISSAEHPNEIHSIAVSEDLLPPLWFRAVTGCLNAQTNKAFEQANIHVDAFSFGAHSISELIGLVIKSEIRNRRAVRSGSTAFHDLTTPFDVSMLELGLYRSPKYQWWQEPLIVVGGSTLEDFCLYYCLSRVRDRVVWALPSISDRALGPNPSGAMSATETSFLFGLLSADRSRSSTGEIGCIASSLSRSQIDSVTEQLNRVGSFSRDIRIISDVVSLVRFPLTAVERDNFQRDIPVQVSDDWSIGPFSTPKPKHFEPIHPYEHRYITQLEIVGDAPPKHAELGTPIVLHPALTTDGARVGRNGPAYFCPTDAYFGGDIDTVLIRPRLHFPSLDNIVKELAQKQGYDCRLSDKGIYADESISKWGSLGEVSTFLRNTQYRSLLDQYLDTSKSGPAKGVYLDGDRRRYLDLASIKALVPDRSASLIDDLISKQVLYRGFIFRCSFCRNSHWYSVSGITQEFKCRRCGRSQLYTKANWKNPDEPAWFYKLDELVYQGHRQGMAVSLLALNYLKETAERSFTFTTEREFWKPGAGKPEIEVDFFCAPDGVLSVGEAKTENCLGNGISEETAKIARYKHLVMGLSTAQLVFATLRNCWRRETIDAIVGAFADLRHVRLVFLDGPKLL